MLIFDAHLDISMNAVEWNRDLTKTLTQVREREAGKMDYADRGKGVLTLEEMRRGEIGLCVATQIGRYVAPDNPLPGWNSPDIAWSITQAQLAQRTPPTTKVKTDATSKAVFFIGISGWKKTGRKATFKSGLGALLRWSVFL